MKGSGNRADPPAADVLDVGSAKGLPLLRLLPGDEPLRVGERAGAATGGVGGART